jgi:hypothetical protein
MFAGREVTGGGAGVVSHAGLVLLRHLSDKTGLTSGSLRALATVRMLIHNPGRRWPIWPARSRTVGWGPSAL